MNLMDQLAAEKKAAQAILAKGMENITDNEQEELKQHYAEAKKLQERIDLFKEAGEGLDGLAGASKGERKHAEAKTLGDFYLQSLQAKGLSVLATKAGLFSTPEFKAVRAVPDPDRPERRLAVRASTGRGRPVRLRHHERHHHQIPGVQQARRRRRHRRRRRTEAAAAPAGSDMGIRQPA